MGIAYSDSFSGEVSTNKTDSVTNETETTRAFAMLPHDDRSSSNEHKYNNNNFKPPQCNG